MPEITVTYDNVILGPNVLAAWNDSYASLTDWWDDDEEWFVPAKGDREIRPARFSPKALPSETLAQWWDAIGGMWYKVAHDYPLSPKFSV